MQAFGDYYSDLSINRKQLFVCLSVCRLIGLSGGESVSQLGRWVDRQIDRQTDIKPIRLSVSSSPYREVVRVSDLVSSFSPTVKLLVTRSSRSVPDVKCVEDPRTPSDS